MNETPLKTEFQLEVEKRHAALYAEYKEKMKVPGAMKKAVVDFLLRKFKYRAISTVYEIIKAEERKEEQKIEREIN